MPKCEQSGTHLRYRPLTMDPAKAPNTPPISRLSTAAAETLRDLSVSNFLPLVDDPTFFLPAHQTWLK
jgi:hypothetical protein